MVSPVDRFVECWWWVLSSFQWLFNLFNIIGIALTILSWFRYARKVAATILVPRIRSYEPPSKSALLAFTITGLGLSLIPFVLIFSIIYATLPYLNLTFYGILIISFVLFPLFTFWITIAIDRILISFIGLRRRFKGASRYGGVRFEYYKECPKCKQQYKIQDETIIIRDRLVTGYKCPFCHEVVYL